MTFLAVLFGFHSELGDVICGSARGKRVRHADFYVVARMRQGEAGWGPKIEIILAQTELFEAVQAARRLLAS